METDLERGTEMVKHLHPASVWRCTEAEHVVLDGRSHLIHGEAEVHGHLPHCSQPRSKMPQAGHSIMVFVLVASSGQLLSS